MEMYINGPFLENSSTNMPRKYNDEQLDAAVKAVSDGYTYKDASSLYGIPVGTLYNKLKGRHLGKVGKPVALGEDFEKRVAVMITFLNKWKLPIQVQEFLNIVKDVLDKCNIVIPDFSDNKPSRKWLTNFLERQNLKIRFADNLKPTRAAVNEEVINVSK